MTLHDILKVKGSKVYIVGPEATLDQVVAELSTHNVGSLMVCDRDLDEGERVLGIITERDILRECGERCVRIDPSSTPDEVPCLPLVKDAMTKELIIGGPNDDPDYVMGVMTDNHIRHLPIMEESSLVGIISIGDLVNAHLEERVIERHTLKEYLTRNSAA